MRVEVKRGAAVTLGRSPAVSKFNWYPEAEVHPCPKPECKVEKSGLDDDDGREAETTAERGGRDRGCWESVGPDKVGGLEEDLLAKAPAYSMLGWVYTLQMMKMDSQGKAMEIMVGTGN